jgi:hypothetical protein
MFMNLNLKKKIILSLSYFLFHFMIINKMYFKLIKIKYYYVNNKILFIN